MLKIVQSIEFKNKENRFQQTLSKDSSDIKRNTSLLIPADKTTNFYKVEPKQYQELLEKNITKDYKKAPVTVEKDINMKDKQIASRLELDDRINTTAKCQAFITLKDHKPSFKNKPTCRLINPTKSEIGKISKHILERINAKIRDTAKFNQWKNTNDVITWYQ